MKFLSDVFENFTTNRCTILAAGLAYYTAFALPPLLFLLLTVLTAGLSVAYDDEQAEEKAYDLLHSKTAQLMGNPAAAEEIGAILKNTRDQPGKWWKALVSFALIVVSATGVVAALQAALNQVWAVRPDPEKAGIFDLVKKRLVSLAMILAFGFILLVSLILTSVLSAVGNHVGSLVGMSDAVAVAVNFSVQALIVFTMFAAIFRFMPDAVIAWKDVFLGAAVTMALFLLGRYGMQLFFRYSEPGAQLGDAAASLAVLLVWVYYSSIIVLVGAIVTKVYAMRRGREIYPESNAVRVVESLERQ